MGAASELRRAFVDGKMAGDKAEGRKPSRLVAEAHQAVNGHFSGQPGPENSLHAEGCAY